MVCMGGKFYCVGGVVYFKFVMYVGLVIIVIDVDNDLMMFLEYCFYCFYKEKINMVKIEFVSLNYKW